MVKLTIHTKPLSINDATKGKHFPTAAKRQFEMEMRFALPKVAVEGKPYYRVRYDFHLVNFHLTDYDNCIKVLQDCLVKRGIITEDRKIVEAIIRKFPAKKDRIEVHIEGVGLEGLAA